MRKKISVRCTCGAKKESHGRRNGRCCVVKCDSHQCPCPGYAAALRSKPRARRKK